MTVAIPTATGPNPSTLSIFLARCNLPPDSPMPMLHPTAVRLPYYPLTIGFCRLPSNGVRWEPPGQNLNDSACFIGPAQLSFPALPLPHLLKIHLSCSLYISASAAQLQRTLRPLHLQPTHLPQPSSKLGPSVPWPHWFLLHHGACNVFP